MNESRVDVAIIGGGPAGLSAALFLGRSCRTCVVIDEERPRNRVTRQAHAFLTRDGITPAEFHELAKADVLAYPSVQFHTDVATHIERQNKTFTITTHGGAVIEAKKVLLATGLRDLLPDIPGFEAVYGQSAFVCPYCDGFEHRDEPLLLIPHDGGGHGLAKSLYGWSKRLTLATHGPTTLTAEEQADLTAHQIPVYQSPIRQIESEAGQVTNVHLDDGSVIPCQAIFIDPMLAPGRSLPQQLGLEFVESGGVKIREGGSTNVHGVYVAGDVTYQRLALIWAAADGAMAAVQINHELLDEDWSN